MTDLILGSVIAAVDAVGRGQRETRIAQAPLFLRPLAARGLDGFAGEVEVVHARGEPVGVGLTPGLFAQPGEQLRRLRTQRREVLDAAQREGIGDGLELGDEALLLLGRERLQLLGVEILLQPGAAVVEDLIDQRRRVFRRWLGSGGRGGRDRSRCRRDGRSGLDGGRGGGKRRLGRSGSGDGRGWRGR